MCIRIDELLKRLSEIKEKCGGDVVVFMNRPKEKCHVVIDEVEVVYRPDGSAKVILK